MAAYVLSRECPSTNTSSVPSPISGVRANISGMLPSSLRAGTITETDGRFAHVSGRDRGRATIKFVRAKCLNGQSLTRNLYTGRPGAEQATAGGFLGIA